MGIKTKDEYIESLRKMNPVAYMFGERITNVVDNPRLRAGIEATGATYEIAEKDEYKDMVVTESPSHQRRRSIVLRCPRPPSRIWWRG